jgi:putative hemolysin
LEFSFIRLLKTTLSPGLLVINPQATTILAIVILFLLILSFVLAGSEVAFFSLTYKDINILKTKQDTSWKRIVSLLEEPKTLLASLLIANSIINIAIIILSNFLIDEMVLLKQDFWLFEFLIKVILIGFVIILFGEVMPKIWATQNNLQLAYYTSGIIELVHLLFRRVGAWAVQRSEGLERAFGGKTSAFQPRTTGLPDRPNHQERSLGRGKKYPQGDHQVRQHYRQTDHEDPAGRQRRQL